MNTGNSKDNQSRSPLKNWYSLTGLTIICGAIFSFLLLSAMDFVQHFSNPYIGILAYFVAPGFVGLGLFLIAIGFYTGRQRIAKAIAEGRALPSFIDISKPADRKRLVLFGIAAVGFLLVSAVGSYKSYHYSESEEFCGLACHAVMGPEHTAHQNSPHANVSCSECHVGPSVTSFLRAKINGTRQLLMVARNNYHRPIETPIKGMGNPKEICGQCHWPKMFYGNFDRVYDHYLSDKTSPHYAVHMLLKVGGSHPSQGPVGGSHWHKARKIEYVAKDEKRQTIPWIRMTDEMGKVTEFRASKFKEVPNADQLHTMDCLDCHNRPAHNFQAPADAVDQAMALGKIDPTLPSIKKLAVSLLAKEYSNENEAVEKIEATMTKEYPSEPRAIPAIAELKRIYRQNFFPEMKVSWKSYPDNIGHKNWPGCFRCHDGEHTASDGKKISNDCNICHTILAQGNGEALNKLSATSLKFEHPAGDIEGKCSDCHTGGPQ